MQVVRVELIGGQMPTKGSEYAAAYDVYVPKDIELTKSRQVIPLGFCIQLPMDWKANMRPRSGFSAKGMEAEVRTTYRKYNGEEYVATEKVRIDADVLLGLIDCDYRDECGVIVKCYDLNYQAKQQYEFDTLVENHIFLTRGTRIAQMEISHKCDLVEVERVDRNIDRGGGFGHTGA